MSHPLLSRRIRSQGRSVDPDEGGHQGRATLSGPTKKIDEEDLGAHEFPEPPGVGSDALPEFEVRDDERDQGEP